MELEAIVPLLQHYLPKCIIVSRICITSYAPPKSKIILNDVLLTKSIFCPKMTSIYNWDDFVDGVDYLSSGYTKATKHLCEFSYEGIQL